MQLCLMCRFWW